MGSDKSLKIILLTGEKKSGKSTWLIENQMNKAGVISPLKNKKRHFLLLPENNWIAMERANGSVKVGKHTFDQKAFDQAETHLRSKLKEEILLLDEIGPLEIKGGGFSILLTDLLNFYRGHLILVIRSGLVEEVISHFNLGRFQIEIVEIEEVQKGKVLFQ